MTWPEEQLRERRLTYHLACCEVGGQETEREDKHQDILEQHFCPSFQEQMNEHFHALPRCVCTHAHRHRRDGFCDLLFETREERRGLKGRLPQSKVAGLSGCSPHQAPLPSTRKTNR